MRRTSCAYVGPSSARECGCGPPPCARRPPAGCRRRGRAGRRGGPPRPCSARRGGRGTSGARRRPPAGRGCAGRRCAAGGGAGSWGRRPDARRRGPRGQGAFEQRERDGLDPLGAARAHACVGEALEEFGLVLGVGFEAVEAAHAALAGAAGEDHLECGVIQGLAARRQIFAARGGGHRASAVRPGAVADSRTVRAGCRWPTRAECGPAASGRGGPPGGRPCPGRRGRGACGRGRRDRLLLVRGERGLARGLHGLPHQTGGQCLTSFSQRVRFSPRKVTRP